MIAVYSCFVFYVIVTTVTDVFILNLSLNLIFFYELCLNLYRVWIWFTENTSKLLLSTLFFRLTSLTFSVDRVLGGLFYIEISSTYISKFSFYQQICLTYINVLILIPIGYLHQISLRWLFLYLWVRYNYYIGRHYWEFVS